MKVHQIKINVTNIKQSWNDMQFEDEHEYIDKRRGAKYLEENQGLCSKWVNLCTDRPLHSLVVIWCVLIFVLCITNVFINLANSGVD